MLICNNSQQSNNDIATLADLFTLKASFLSRWRASTANGMYMMTKASIVLQTATFSISFWPISSNTVAKLIVLTGVTNPAPKPPSKLLLNSTFSGVADSTYVFIRYTDQRTHDDMSMTIIIYICRLSAHPTFQIMRTLPAFGLNER